jgi:tetratricopeptide (TPR) repeat protein
MKNVKILCAATAIIFAANTNTWASNDNCEERRPLKKARISEGNKENVILIPINMQEDSLSKMFSSLSKDELKNYSCSLINNSKHIPLKGIDLFCEEMIKRKEVDFLNKRSLKHYEKDTVEHYRIAATIYRVLDQHKALPEDDLFVFAQSLNKDGRYREARNLFARYLASFNLSTAAGISSNLVDIAQNTYKLGRQEQAKGTLDSSQLIEEAKKIYKEAIRYYEDGSEGSFEEFIEEIKEDLEEMDAPAAYIDEICSYRP